MPPAEQAGLAAQLDNFLDALASKQSTPSGGAVVAATTANALSLLAMVARLSADEVMAERLRESAASALSLGDDDAAGFRAVMRCYRTGGEALEAALIAAMTPPLATIELIGSRLADVAWLAASGNANLISDVVIGADLLGAAVRAAAVNVEVNALASTIAAAPERLAVARRQSAALTQQLTRVGASAAARMRSRPEAR